MADIPIFSLNLSVHLAGRVILFYILLWLLAFKSKKNSQSAKYHWFWMNFIVLKLLSQGYFLEFFGMCLLI